MDAQQFYNLLITHGVNLDGIKLDDLAKHLTETLIIKKYAFAGPPDRADEPFETLTFQNGELMEIHSKRLP
jgi:hypothetical protein